jgi:GT2 family glycosyltransferase
MSDSRILIIILCYNGIELTRACLQSLRGLASPADVLVVDNASSDGTAAIVRQEFPEVSVLETGANLGYAGGNNVGLKVALEQGYDFALLLNNDTEVASDFVAHLEAACDADPTIAVAGPKVYYFDEPGRIYSAGGRIDWRTGFASMVGLDEEDRGQYEESAEVDFVSGCALLVRCAVLPAVGLLDERFGMYYEETEWCVRIARAGGRVVYVPQSRIWHKIAPAEQAQSPRVAYYMARNRLLFLRLTGAPPATWVRAALGQDARTWLSYSLRPKWRARRPQRDALARGWRDFLRGRYGMA